VAAKFAVPAVRDSLKEIGIDRPERLLDMLVMDIEPGVARVEDGPVNTDYHPFIEFSAPRSALNDRADTNQKVLLDRFREVPSDYLAGLSPEAVAEVGRGREALRLVLQASLRRSHGELRETVNLLREAMRLAPNSPIIRNELVSSLILLAGQADQPGEALALYQEVLRVNPTDFWAFYHLEMRARGEQQLDLAADCLRRAIEAHPDSAMFLAMRGRQRGMAGDPQAACKDLEAALKILPRRADFWHIYADFLDRAGRAAEAQTARSRAARANRG
jgi:tetratricopeptide (TPR) repeat protein